MYKYAISVIQIIIIEMSTVLATFTIIWLCAIAAADQGTWSSILFL